MLRTFLGRPKKITRAKPQNESPGPPKKSILENFGGWITIIISVLSFLYGILQFTYNEAMVDVRKYNNAYYEERYKAFKSIASSISDIQSITKYTANPPIESLRKPLSTFEYGLLVLDKNQRSDSLIVECLEKYEDDAYILVSGHSAESDPEKLWQLGDSIILQFGTILKHEKDSINSVHSLWSVWGY